MRLECGRAQAFGTFSAEEFFGDFMLPQLMSGSRATMALHLVPSVDVAGVVAGLKRGANVACPFIIQRQHHTLIRQGVQQLFHPAPWTNPGPLHAPQGGGRMH